MLVIGRSISLPKEWSNPFNSFNSFKSLLYGDYFKAVFDKKFIAPIEASLDPIHACNLLCQHCNAHRYLAGGDLNDLMRMPDEHLDRLIEFLACWGVKAICFGGGGEPTLHTHLGYSLTMTKILGMESSIATNGTLFTPQLIEIMADCCRWVGVSVDAATPKTYQIGRNKDLFDQALKNIKSLVREVKKQKSNCDVSYKFLIMPHNQNEIYDACVVAKETGVRDFHARPADFRHQGMGELKRKNNEYNVDKIKEQFEKCHELEDNQFRVFTVMHKFTEDFTPSRNFNQCYAAPLCIQLCADGNVYFCVDQRHQKKYLLGTHYPDPHNILNFWGKENHQKLVFGCTPKTCGTRCTFGFYNKVAEEVFTDKDPFCKNFI